MGSSSSSGLVVRFSASLNSKSAISCHNQMERVTVKKKKEMIGETSTKEKWELTMRAAERQKAAPLELDSEYSS